MKTSEQINEIAAALAKAQGQLKNPETNRHARIPTKSGAVFEYDYADLPTILDCARNPLSDNGIAHVGTIVGRMDPHTGATLIMRLIHTSGQWIESEYPLPEAGDPKALAASITYGRRYLFQTLVGVAGDDDTDDKPEADATYKNKEKENKEKTHATHRPVASPAPSRKVTPKEPEQAELPDPGTQAKAEVRLAGENERAHILTLVKGNWSNALVQKYMQQRWNKSKITELTMPEYQELASALAAYTPEEVMQ